MSLKECNFNERTQRGNEKAALVAAYLNHRLGMGWEQTNLHEDEKEKLDFKRKLKDGRTQTAQVKVRDQREDVIHEHTKFKKKGKKSYRVESGRDALCKANLYICKPKVFEPERIDITRTSDVKRVTEEAMAEWRQTGEADFTDENIHDWWKRANWHRNQQVCLFTAKDGTQIYFKIDEGDRITWGKLLSFVRPQTLRDRDDCYLRTIYLQPGENLYDPSTWKDYR